MSVAVYESINCQVPYSLLPLYFLIFFCFLPPKNTIKILFCLSLYTIRLFF